jgi:parallel beta-helix repeat protein
VEHSSWNLIAGNYVISNGAAGIFVTGDTAESNNVVGNYSLLNTTQGIYLFSTGKYNAVRGNQVVQNQNYGILVSSGVSDCQITGNTVNENSQQTDATWDGITLTTNCDRNFIAGNTVRRGAGAKKQRYGINIDTSTCDGNVFGQNDCYDGGSTAYARDAGTGTIVQVQDGLTADAGDADYTHTPWSNPASVIYATTRTAARSVTFQNAGALKGMRATVSVQSGGAFDVLAKNNAGTTLAALGGNGARAEVVFNGTAWVLLSVGQQQSVTFATTLKWGSA